MEDITEAYTQYCYNNYYGKPTDWNSYYEYLAEEEDRKREDLEND